MSASSAVQREAQAFAGFQDRSHHQHHQHNQYQLGQPTSPSFPSPAAPSMLSAAQASTDSSFSSGITALSSDHSNSANLTLIKKRPRPLPLSVDPAPRSSSLAAVPMGQNISRPEQQQSQQQRPPQPQQQALPSNSTSTPPPSSSSQPKASATASTGFKLRRAFAARKGKPDDSKWARQDKKFGTVTGPTPTATNGQPQALTSGRNPLHPKHIIPSPLNVFAGKKSSNNNSPPPLPPKPPVLQVSKKFSPPPGPQVPANAAAVRYHQRGSISPLSPNISSAMVFTRKNEEREREPASAIILAPNLESESESETESERESVAQPRSSSSSPDFDPNLDHFKQDWRKSDATVTTARPSNAPVLTSGYQSHHWNSRPVSITESLHSTHTIVPVSATTLGENDELKSEEMVGSTDSHPHEYAVIVGNPNRHQHTHNLNRVSSPQSPSNKYAHLRPSEERTSSNPSILSHAASPPILISSPTSRETPTLNKAAANGIIVTPSNPSTHNNTQPSGVGMNIRERFVAWTAAAAAHVASSPAPSQGGYHSSSSSPPPPPHAQIQPPPIYQMYSRSSKSSNQISPPSTRPPAISLTGSFAPAGLAKRAVEKMGRAWGGFSSSSSSSGYSSSSSSVSPPSSYSGASTPDHHLHQTHHVLGNVTGSSAATETKSAVVPQVDGKGFNSKAQPPPPPRRTKNGPSGAWSIASSAVTSSSVESDLGVGGQQRQHQPQFSMSSMSSISTMAETTGPYLGQQLRGPSMAGGMVFGRDLQMCTRETAIKRHGGIERMGGKEVSLERRMIPAVVVRCAQHLLHWGVQEEGLFRVSGRPYHVSKLRSEFDTGADYDISECTPGDLDPHAVASVFKAYLRELPEPILTRALIPYFEAAISAENQAIELAQSISSTPATSRVPKGPSLPSNVRNGTPMLRKPPSLSTLAMPNFTSMKPPSKPLLKAFQALIAQLPQENRDLIHTVVELIQATARESKKTKMPLSNLLLVFCPSLNMNPPLLRVLCEGEDIWGDVDAAPRVEATAAGKGAVGEGMGLLPPSADVVHESQVFNVVAAKLAKDSVDDVSVRNPADLEAARALEEKPSEHDLVWTDMEDKSCAKGSPSAASATRAAESGMNYEQVSPETASTHSVPSKRSTPTIGDDHHPDGLPPLSTSTESVVTPSTLSYEPSISSVVIPEDSCTKPTTSSVALHLPLPVIAEPPVLEIPHSLRIGVAINNPVRTTPSLPITPVDQRRSIPHLSLPSRESQSASEPASPNALTRVWSRGRLKASLQLRHAKPTISYPSATSLVSFSPHTPHAPPQPRPASDSSVSTPTSAFTAQSSTSQLPPLLDTRIDDSSIRLGMGIDDDGYGDKGRKNDIVPHPQPQPAGSLAISSPSYTPLADFFSTPAGSTSDFTTTRTAGSTVSQNRLGALPHLGREEEKEDWTRSVLLAADLNADMLLRYDGKD